MDEGGASRAALNLLDAGYKDIHVVSGGLARLAEEAERRGLRVIQGTPEAAEAAVGGHH